MLISYAENQECLQQSRPISGSSSTVRHDGTKGGQLVTMVTASDRIFRFVNYKKVVIRTMQGAAGRCVSGFGS